MKNTAFYLLLVLFFFNSCKRENKNPSTDKKTYNVNFNIEGFTQEIISSRNNLHVNSLHPDSVAIGSYLTMLYYYVFNSDGGLVHEIKQDSSASNFGAISDKLPAGTYTVLIVAGKRYLLARDAVDFVTGQTVQQRIWAQYLYKTTATLLPNGSKWDDTFADKFQLTVSAADINQRIVLKRIVGQLEVHLLDELPVTASTIKITVNKETFNYALDADHAVAEGGGAITMTNVIPAAAKGNSDYIIDYIVANTLNPFIVTITCYDAADKVLGTVTVNDVVCQKNKKTVLTGHLFGSDNGVIINLTPLSPTIITVPF